jgi:malate dehydrogenase (oxaloacetate-decarboxylating)
MEKPFRIRQDVATGESYYETSLTGENLLNNWILNKTSAFSPRERLELGVDGFLPTATQTLGLQVSCAYEQFKTKDTDLGRYIFLNSLLDRNVTVFFRLILDHLSEMIPIIYTPTVGLACQRFSKVFRRPRGLYINPGNIDRIDEILASVPFPSVRLIVVTDGERILGLGDQGADGMGIPIGKVGLYVAAGCLHPSEVLPVTVDVGTNNQEKLEDQLYIGWRHKRLMDQEYYDFIDKFVEGVKRAFPGVLLQWEDFAKHHAFNLLDKYRQSILSFNDDIQGTGATALAALNGAARIKGVAMKDMRYCIAGAGEAGTGIGQNIVAALKAEGLSDQQAKDCIYPVDRQGLLLDDDPTLEPQQHMFTKSRAHIAGWKLRNPEFIDIIDIIHNARTNVLIGTTANPGRFTEEILKAMAEVDDRPVIMPLSNPTSRVECTPEQVCKATNGCFIMATGSPFPPIETKIGMQGIAQCNNLFIFPGVGLGALVSQATEVTDSMFAAGARALAALVTPEQAAKGYVLPEMKYIREASAEVAIAVAREARDCGVGIKLTDAEIKSRVMASQWNPAYIPVRKA